MSKACGAGVPPNATSFCYPEKAWDQFKVQLLCVTASRTGPLGSCVKQVRLLRFRLGADRSPALSAQAWHTDLFDARPIGRLRRNGFDRLTAFGPIRTALALGVGGPGKQHVGGGAHHADTNGWTPFRLLRFLQPSCVS